MDKTLLVLAFAVPFLNCSTASGILTSTQSEQFSPNLQTLEYKVLGINHEYFRFILWSDAGVVHLYQDVLVISGDWCLLLVLEDLWQIP